MPGPARPAYARAVPEDIEQLARLADQLVLGVVRLGATLLVERANLAAHVLLGRRPGSLAGRSVMEAFLDHRAEEAVLVARGGASANLELDGPEGRRLGTAGARHARR